MWNLIQNNSVDNYEFSSAETERTSPETHTHIGH